jgi:hypothetical protein
VWSCDYKLGWLSCVFRVHLCAMAWIAFYRTLGRGYHLFPYNLGTKLHKGRYLCRVTRVVCRGLIFHYCPMPHPIDLARVVTHLVRGHALGAAVHPIHHRRGVASQRPHARILHHVPSTFDRSVLHDVVA